MQNAGSFLGLWNASHYESKHTQKWCPVFGKGSIAAISKIILENSKNEAKMSLKREKKNFLHSRRTPVVLGNDKMKSVH